jgi:transcriptional regulator with XRE-family HTH domain/DNA-binding XRE family transcriptional regulator
MNYKMDNLTNNSYYKNEQGSLNLRGRELRARLVRKGVPMLEIAKKLGIRRQAVDYFIRTNGIYDDWKKSSDFFLRNRNNVQEQRENLERQRRNVLETIAAQVNEVLLQRLDETFPIERKSYDMAVQYLEGFPKRYSFRFLFDFYSHVNSLIENEKEFSYADVATEFGLHAPAARRILILAGIKSSNKPLPRKRVSEEQRFAIRRLLDQTKMSQADISYFVGVSGVTVMAIHHEDGNGRVVNPEDMFFADFGCKGRVTPRRASQIYELMDKRVNYYKIKKRLKIGNKVLYDAIANRGRYSDIIIDNLRKIYPDREIIRPYLD